MLKEMTTDELMMIDGGHWTYAESQGKNNFSEREGRRLGRAIIWATAGAVGSTGVGAAIVSAGAASYLSDLISGN